MWLKNKAHKIERKTNRRIHKPILPLRSEEGRTQTQAGLLLRVPRGPKAHTLVTSRLPASNLLLVCSSLILPGSSTLLRYDFISLWSSLPWPCVRLIFLFHGRQTKFPSVRLTSPVAPSCLEAYGAGGSHHPFPHPRVRKCKHSGWPDSYRKLLGKEWGFTRCQRFH